MDHGIKVSKKGYDVKTCDDKDLVFTSTALALKLKDKGTATLGLPDNWNSNAVYINHNLGYQPYAQTFTDIYNKRYNSTQFNITEQDIPEKTLGGTTGAFLWTEVTNTQIIIRIALDDTGSKTANGNQYFNVFWYYAIDEA